MLSTITLSGNCTLEVIKTSESLADLGPIWDPLVARAGLTHPFLTHDWIRTWWECFGGNAELRILVVRADGEPIAIAPFMLTTKRVYGKRVRSLRLLANDHTPRADVIVADRPDDAYSAIWNFLMSGSADWDLLMLRDLPADSPTLRELTIRAEQCGILSGYRSTNESPFIPMAQEWDGYMTSLPAKHRSNLRNRLKRLSALGPIEVETISSESGQRDALDEGFRLEAAAWKDRAGTAIRCEQNTLRFYTLLAERSAARGWLRLQFLKVGNRRIAFDYCLAYQNRIFLLKPGFDPQYAAYSPGNLLVYLALQDAFASGFAAYDLLGRDDSWKRQWSSHTQTHGWLFLFANRPWARFAHYAKFEVIPALHKFPLYERLRDRMFGATT